MNSTPSLQSGHPMIPQGVSLQQLQEQIRQLQDQLGLVTGTKQVEPPDTSERTYYSRFPGSNIVVLRKGPNGENVPDMLFFDAFGELKTSDPVVHAFLKPLLGGIVSVKPVDAGDPVLATAAKEVQAAAAKSIEKMGAEAPKQ